MPCSCSWWRRSVPRSATRTRPVAGGWIRSSSSSESSWHASSTTPSPTTSRPSPSGPRPAASWPPPIRPPRWTHSPSSSRRPLGRSRRCARWSAPSARERNRTSHRSAASPRSSDLATGAGERPRVDVELSGDLDGLPTFRRCRHLPPRPGVDHQRRAPRPPRHPRPGGGAGRARLRRHDGARRRRSGDRSIPGRRPGSGWSGWPNGRSCSAAPSKQAPTGTGDGPSRPCCPRGARP